MNRSEAGRLGATASLGTRNKNKALRVEEYNNNPIRCWTCDCIFPYESRHKKFCDSSCAAKKNNLGVVRNGVTRFKPTKVAKPNCLNCSKSLKKNSRKFCSPTCFADYHWKLKKEKISLDGKAEGIAQAKRYLKATRPNRCEMCGVDTWAGKPIMLVCDHINGNSEDWNLSNLRLICSNCDATTPFYKNRNKGNGRHKRRERYHSGKSY
jgi:hypothetical protein